MPLQISTPEGNAIRTDATQQGATPFDNLDVTAVDAWINTNVTDLASAKTALRIAAKWIISLNARLKRIEIELSKR